MNTKILFAALIALAVPVAAQAQTTLAGWSFGQFLSEGFPAIDGDTGEAVDFIAATYRGSFNPNPNVVDGTITSAFEIPGFDDTTFGSFSFANFNVNNAFDVRADNVGSLNTVNSTTLDGKQMHLTDSGSRTLSFNVTNTLWTITVGDTTGFTNVAGANNDFTFAATTTSGATVEWLYNGNVFATSTITAPGPDDVPYASYGVDFSNQAADFYSTGVFQGRLTAGAVKFDNVQVNGTAIPEASSFAALAGLAGLAFTASRRRRA